MIKCHIRRGGTVKIRATGTGEDLVPETLLLIQQVYRGIKKVNPEVAEKYKTTIIGSLLDPNSPVWRETQ